MMTYRTGAEHLIIAHDLHPLVPRVDLEPAPVPGPGLGDPEAAHPGPGH